MSNTPVPNNIKKMLGHGHNDKGIYFCPNCGIQIQRLKDEHGDEYCACPSCNKKFNIAIGNDYN